MLVFVVGYLIGKHRFKMILEPDGEIVFTSYLNDEDEEVSKCIFQLDLEIEDIKKQNYILFKVVKENK